MQNEKDRDKMRILIVSDTHGKHDNLQKIFLTEEAFDLMLHLGDAEGGYEDILSLTPCPLHIVAGNMDGLSGLPEEKMLTLDGYRVWMRHGHQGKGFLLGWIICGKKQKNGRQISFSWDNLICRIWKREAALPM